MAIFYAIIIIKVKFQLSKYKLRKNYGAIIYPNKLWTPYLSLQHIKIRCLGLVAIAVVLFVCKQLIIKAN